MAALAWLGPIGSLLRFFGKEVSDWSRRRDKLKEVSLEAKVAEIKATAEIAAYKAKADIEWDLAWAGQAKYSWKDEWLLILWSIPTVIFMLMVPFQSGQESIMEILLFLKELNPYILEFYMAMWGVIFAAAFGLKAITQGTLGGRVAKITEAFATVPDDVPNEAVEAATDRITKALDKGLF